MKFRKTIVAGFAVVLTGLLTACGSSASSSQGTTITKMTGDVISSMDPSTITDEFAGQALVECR